MAATGNEAVRLEQLKGVYPQVVSYHNGESASITLGNGKVVTFSSQSVVTFTVHLLVKVMHNCFEILQAVSELAPSVIINVTCQEGMNTFMGKIANESSYILYTSTDGQIHKSSVNVNAKTFSFNTNNKSALLIGAIIYVD